MGIQNFPLKSSGLWTWALWCQLCLLCSGDLCPVGGCSHGLLAPLQINTLGRDTGPLWAGGKPVGTSVQQKEHQWVGNPGACAHAQPKHFHKMSCCWEMSPYSHAQPGFLCHVLEAASCHLSPFESSHLICCLEPSLSLPYFWILSGFCLETSFLLQFQLHRLRSTVELL